MNKLIFLIPLLFNGCLYINQDVGLTTYQYDKCVEYYDEKGTYHKDCPDSVVEKGVDIVKKTGYAVVETTKSMKDKISPKTDKSVKSSKQKRCVCKKSCIKSCLQNYSKQTCIKKCCYEK